ncbi:MAG: LysE family translocator [Bacteroidota bacterium]
MENLLLFFSASLLLLITPGPSILYISTNSVLYGRRPGLTSVVGVATGLMCHVLAGTLGLSVLIMNSSYGFEVVKWIGAVYLIITGVKSLLRSPAIQKRKSELVKPIESAHFRGGVITAIFNPKVALFFIAFIPQFVDPSLGAVHWQMLLLGTVYVLMALVINSIVALLSHLTGTGLMKSNRISKWSSKISGMIFITLGIRFAFMNK